MTKEHNNIVRVLSSATRSIDVDEDRGIIIHTLKVNGSKTYFTYNKILLDIIKLPSVYPFYNNGRLRYRFHKGSGEMKFYAYDLAYCCYYGLVTSADTFPEELDRYYNYKNFSGLVIDHADDNKQNNTILNISLMEAGENSAKSATVSRVKLPLSLNSVYIGDGAYKVRMCFDNIQKEYINSLFDRFGKDMRIEDGNGKAVIRFYCRDSEEYIRCLKFLTQTVFEFADPLRDRRGKWIDNNNPCRVSNINYSLEEQRVIATELFDYQNFIPLDND